MNFFNIQGTNGDDLMGTIAKRSVSIMDSIGNAAASTIGGTVRLLPLNPIRVVSAPNVSSYNTLNRGHITTTRGILHHYSVTILMAITKAPHSRTRASLVSLFIRGGVPFIVTTGGTSLLTTIPRGRSGVICMDTHRGTNVRTLGGGVNSLSKGRPREGLTTSLILPNSFTILIAPVSSTTPGNEVVLPRRRIVESIVSTNTITVIIHRARLRTTLASLNGGPTVIVASSRTFNIMGGVIPPSVPLASFSVLVTECGNFLNATLGNTTIVSALGSNSGILVDRNYARRERYSSVNAIGLPH